MTPPTPIPLPAPALPRAVERAGLIDRHGAWSVAAEFELIALRLREAS